MWKLLAVLIIGLAISHIRTHENVKNQDNAEHQKNHQEKLKNELVQHSENKEHEHVEKHLNNKEHAKNKEHEHVEHPKNKHHEHVEKHLKNKEHEHVDHSKNKKHEHVLKNPTNKEHGHVEHPKEHPKNKNHFKNKNHAHEKRTRKEKHQIAHSPKHFSLNHFSYHSKHHVKNRDNSPENSTTSDFTFQSCYNSETSTEIIAQQNGSGFAFNFSSQIAIIFSDQTRLAIAYNLQTQIGVEITNRNTTTWAQVISQTASLEHLIQIGTENGTSFNLSSIPDPIAQTAESILKNLSSDYSQFSGFLNDTQTIINFFRRAPNIFSAFQTGIPSGFRSYIQRLIGLGALLGNNSYNGTLSASDIFSPATGLNAFISVIQQLGRFFNPSSYLGQNLLPLIDRFGSPSNPFDRFLHVINEIVQILSGNGVNPDFVPSVIELFADSANFPNYLSQWRASFRNLSDILGNSTRSNASLQEIQQLANLTGNLNGFELSYIFEIFQNSNGTNSINAIVKLFVALSRNLPPQFSIPNLLGELVGLYRNSTNGNCSVLQNLIPNFNINTERDNNNNVVSEFLGLFQNGAQLFFGVPLQIFLLPISQALTQYSNGSLTMSGVFRNPGSLANFANPAGFANILANAGNGWAQLAGNAAHGFGNLVNIPAQIFQQEIGSVLSQDSTTSNPEARHKILRKEKKNTKQHGQKEKH